MIICMTGLAWVCVIFFLSFTPYPLWSDDHRYVIAVEMVKIQNDEHVHIPIMYMVESSWEAIWQRQRVVILVKNPYAAFAHIIASSKTNPSNPILYLLCNLKCQKRLNAISYIWDNGSKSIYYTFKRILGTVQCTSLHANGMQSYGVRKTAKLTILNN